MGTTGVRTMYGWVFVRVYRHQNTHIKYLIVHVVHIVVSFHAVSINDASAAF